MSEDLSSFPDRNIDYRPGLVASTARIVIPVFQKILPSGAFKVFYDKLYALNKRRIWAIYSVKTLVGRAKSNPTVQQKQKFVRKLLPFTMGGPLALENAYDVVTQIGRKGIEGDIVECGVAQGGTAAMMILASNANSSNQRHFWLFDSYEGLPLPTEEDYRGTSTGEFIQPLVEGSCLGTVEQVSELLFDVLSIDKDNVTMIPGWFQDTVPANKDRLGKIAILRLDGDWYESTKIPLDGFYDRISSGGAVIVDDYATCFGSSRAVEEFLAENNIDVTLHSDGRGGVWFIKP